MKFIHQLTIILILIAQVNSLGASPRVNKEIQKEFPTQIRSFPNDNVLVLFALGTLTRDVSKVDKQFQSLSYTDKQVLKKTCTKIIYAYQEEVKSENTMFRIWSSNPYRDKNNPPSTPYLDVSTWAYGVLSMIDNKKSWGNTMAYTHFSLKLQFLDLAELGPLFRDMVNAAYSIMKNEAINNYSQLVFPHISN